MRLVGTKYGAAHKAWHILSAFNYPVNINAILAILNEVCWHICGCSLAPSEQLVCVYTNLCISVVVFLSQFNVRVCVCVGGCVFTLSILSCCNTMWNFIEISRAFHKKVLHKKFFLMRSGNTLNANLNSFNLVILKKICEFT